jgi:hypothetical protein
MLLSERLLEMCGKLVHVINVDFERGQSVTLKNMLPNVAANSIIVLNGYAV